MNRHGRKRRLLKTGAALAVTGLLFSSSCSLDNLEAVMVGLDAATSHLDRQQNDDITFGEWLLSELDD